jgi:hypothetical protein
LEKVAVRDLPYTEQEAFFNGEGGEDEPSTTTGSVEW